MLTVGSLFSGIEGLGLGLERAGMHVVWQSEIDPYCCKVLAKHWPDVPNLGDVTRIEWSEVEPVDLICGGFPCQDISSAGLKTGITGSRSALWVEFARCLGGLRPRYALVENVGDLLVRGLDVVLADLAALGFDAEWCDLPACAMGAPHPRRRLFVVAHAPRDDVANQVPHDPFADRQYPDWQRQPRGSGMTSNRTEAAGTGPSEREPQTEQRRDTCASYNWEIGTEPQVPLDPPEWAHRDRPILVDACIAPAVRALWDAGYVTLSSCCGHGKSDHPPSLVLDNVEQDFAGIRAVIASVDRRDFDLFQWRIAKVGA